MAGVGDKSQQQQPQQQEPYHPTTPDPEFFVHDPSASSSSAKETPAAVQKQVREAGNLRQHLREAEVPTVKPLRTPADPTQAEWEDHSVCHFPYRARCRACVAGRGRADPHFRDTGDDKLKPSVHCDYCFMGEKNDVEEGDGGTLPIIVHKFPGDHWLTSHPIRRKGFDAWAVETCGRDLFEWGVVDFIYKSDQEVGILAFKTHVVAKL